MRQGILFEHGIESKQAFSLQASSKSLALDGFFDDGAGAAGTAV